MGEREKEEGAGEGFTCVAVSCGVRRCQDRRCRGGMQAAGGGRRPTEDVT